MPQPCSHPLIDRQSLGGFGRSDGDADRVKFFCKKCQQFVDVKERDPFDAEVSRAQS